MAGSVIVLNGGSSSGKSALARALQQRLAEPWLTFGVDSLIDAMPPRLTGGDSDDGFDVDSDGTVILGTEFHDLETTWRAGLAAMVRVGANIIIDDVFLSGRASQNRLAAALDGLDVTWVGVRCAPRIAEQRELRRGDRELGMAKHQAERVHVGVEYDIEVDSGSLEPAACAEQVARFVAQRGQASESR